MLNQKNIRSLGYGVLLIIFFKILVFELPHANFTDLAVYYEAGKKILTHHTVYDVPGHFQYKYAPWVSLLFGVLLTPFEFKELSIFFYFFMLMVWLLYAIWIDLEIKSKIPTPFFLFALLINPLTQELTLGQVNWLALAPFTAMYLILKEKSNFRQCLAGLLFCIAFSVKLSLLIAVPFLVFRRLWLTLVSALCSYLILGFGGLSLSSRLSFTWNEHLAWISTLTHSTTDLLSIEGNISLLGILMKATHQLSLSSFFWVCLLCVFIYAQWHYRKKDMTFQLGFQGVSMVLLSPIAWPYWSLFCLPAMIYQSDELLHWGMRSRRNQALALILGLLLIIGFQSQMKIAMNGGRTLCLILILWGLLYSTTRHSLRSDPQD